MSSDQPQLRATMVQFEELNMNSVVVHLAIWIMPFIKETDRLLDDDDDGKCYEYTSCQAVLGYDQFRKDVGPDYERR